MERRKATRVRCEIPCTISVGRKPVPATVRNVNATGLGVDAPLGLTAAGDELDLTLEPAGRPPIDLVAMVWHVRVVRRAARGDPFAQLGLVLSEANDDYLRWIDSLLPPVSSAEGRPSGGPLAAPAPRLRFAVQVAQADSSRTRRIVVVAADADEARAHASEAAGPGWSVVSVRPSRS